MRNLEDLAADIDGYTLETNIRRVMKFTPADIPALERANETEHARLMKLKAGKTNREKIEGIKLMLSMDARTRLIEQIEKFRGKKNACVQSVVLVPPERGRDLPALQSRIMSDWTINEILFFRDFACGGGTFKSTGGWIVNRAGYSAKTNEGQSNLERLFDTLCNLIWLYVGAFAYAQQKPGASNCEILFRHKDEWFDMTPNALIKALPGKPSENLGEIFKELLDANERTQNAIYQGFKNLEPTQAGVDFLVSKKHGRSAAAKAAQAKAKDDADIAKAKDRAAADMNRALQKVRDDKDVKANKHGAVIAACRRVCKEFTPLTTKKNALGKFEQYDPLRDWLGDEIKPDSLARNYRERYGTRKDRKAK